MAKAKKTESWSDNGSRISKNLEHLAGMEEAAMQEAMSAQDDDAPMGTGGPVIQLPVMDIRHVGVTVVGTSALVCHRFSEKARKQILDKQMGKASAGRENKDPDEDYRQSMYIMPNGKPGFPTIAFKCAMVTACTSFGKLISKVQARQAFHVAGELVEIQGDPVMREDMVRLNGKTADVRHRAQFTEWAVTLTIRYNARVLSAEQLVNLLNTAGFGVGVGEWRPEKNGQFGTFAVQ